MDRDSKLIFEVYSSTMEPDLTRICSSCEKECPQFANVHSPGRRTHGLCKRHAMEQIGEILRANPGMDQVLAQQKLNKISNSPDEDFCPDLCQIAK